MEKVKLLVGCACLGISYEWFTSWNKFWTDLVRSAEFEIGCSFKYRKPVSIAQEDLAKEAVDTGATHLLIIDDDVFDFSLLDLVKLLDADKDMIGGAMFTKRFPYHLCAMRRLDGDKPLIEHCKNVTGFDMYEVPAADRKGVVPVDLTSFGFTLFKTDLFKRIKKPYFIPDPAKVDTTKVNYQYSAYTDNIFCDKVFDAGSQPFCHFDVWLNHNGVTRDNLAHWVGIYQQAGMLTQPGIMMYPNEFLKYKMVIKTKMEEAEKRFASQAVNKIKYYKNTEEKPEGKAKGN